MSYSEYNKGKREQTSYAAETTFGTAVTPTRIIARDIVVNPNFSKGFQENLQSGADTLEVTDFIKGPESLPFGLEFTPIEWIWLKYMFGTVANAGSSPAYTHTFSVNNSINSCTIEWAKRGSTNSVLTLAGSTFLKATMAWAKTSTAGREGHIRVNADCQCKTKTEGSSITTLTPPDLVPYQYRMVKFTIDGSEYVEVNSGEITFDRGIDPNESRYSSSSLDVSVGEFIPGTFRIKGRINVNVKDNTFYDLWDAAAAVSGTTKLEFIRGTNDKLVLTFTNFFPLGPGQAPTNLEGTDNLDLAFQALSVAAVATDSIETY